MIMMRIASSLAVVSALSLALFSGCTNSDAEQKSAEEEKAQEKPSGTGAAEKKPQETKPAEKEAAKPNPAMLDPKLANEKAPDTFKVKMSTTKGDFTIEVTRDWSPKGADRFYNLVKIGYFTDVAFFRVIENFMAQFGIHGDPAVSAKWRSANIPDDPVKASNGRGYITFAKSSLPDSRSTQFFINFKDNTPLDRMGFSPFGQVVEGMAVVDSIYKGYGESPDQGRIQMEGNKYLKKDFPNLDYIKSATIIK